MSETGFSPEVHDTIDGRAMGRCEVCGENIVEEHHHRRPRGMGGSKRPDTNTAANGLGVCGICHRMIESNRTVALLLGWLVHSHRQPSEVKVMYRGEWCYLNENGTRWDSAEC